MNTAKFFLLTIALTLFLSGKEPHEHIPVFSEYKNFEPWLKKDNDSTYVVNFWATWCKPCVAELPYFERLRERYEGEKVKVLLVSLDFSEKLESRIRPFVKAKGLKSQVMVLDDMAQHEWIPKVDKNWSGALPATVIYKGNTYDFYEKSFEYDELEQALNKVLNNK